jgi:hypothetical protein
MREKNKQKTMRYRKRKKLLFFNIQILQIGPKFGLKEKLNQKQHELGK